MDDFRVPETPLIFQQGGHFGPHDDIASVDITGLGLTTLRSDDLDKRLRELGNGTASTIPGFRDGRLSPDRHQMPVSAPKRQMLFAKPTQVDKGSSRTGYFSTLTQKFKGGHDTRVHPISAVQAKTQGSTRTIHHSGEYSSYGTTINLPGSQPRDNEGCQSQNSHTGGGDSGYRGIQDAIATKFSDLEKQIKVQDQELTELRFALNDANVATDSLETDKRHLKQKTEELERKLKQSGDNTARLQQDLSNCQDALKKAEDIQRRLREDATKAEEKSKLDKGALADAQITINEARMKLEDTRKELNERFNAITEKHKRDAETSNQEIHDLTRQLQTREAEIRTQRDTNNQLSKQLEEIPERNFQAMSAFAKTILDKLNESRSEILEDGRTVKKQHQNQHDALIQYLKGLLTASKQHLEMLVVSQEESKTLTDRVLEKIGASDCESTKIESHWEAALDNGVNNIQQNLECYQAELLRAIGKKSSECELLANICDKQNKDSHNLADQLAEQITLSRNQMHQIQELHRSLRKLEESPREDPEMVAEIKFLRKQRDNLESEVKERDTQITRLEEGYKDKATSLAAIADKFIADIQQLNNTFHQREEEYRRALDQASELANKEAKRSLDETREETQKELQQERTRRQILEKELRQAKQDFSVLEESSRRVSQSHEALQKDLYATKAGNQAVTEHLEGKVRVLENQLNRDAADTTKLKAALADKETDYANLRSSMDAYEEKLRRLVEHLRSWAQDYMHIKAIRSRLEMLEQIDRSCIVTARIKEAEQIDSIIAQLRQCCGRQNERCDESSFGVEKSQQMPNPHYADDSHEQQVSDLSAFLDAEIGKYQAASYASKDTNLRNGRDTMMPLANLDHETKSLQTPENLCQEHGPGMEPPLVLNDKMIDVKLDPKSSLDSSSPTAALSFVPQHTRRETRALIADNASMRNQVSPTDAKMSRRASRKRMSTFQGQGDAGSFKPGTKRRCAETSIYFEKIGEHNRRMDSGMGGHGNVVGGTNSPPPVYIKIEDL